MSYGRHCEWVTSLVISGLVVNRTIACVLLCFIYINEDILIAFPSAFDEAISLRMVITVSELILTSTRSNRVKRISDETAAKLNYDIFREAPNKFAIRGANYKHTLGIATRYGFALRSIQRRFGQQRNQLKTISKGQVVNIDYYDDLYDELYI